MKKQLLKKLTIATFVVFGFAQVSAQTFTFSTGQDGWSSGYGSGDPVTHAPTEGISGDGALQLTRVNNNSNIGLNSTPGIDATTKKVIKIVYKNGTLGTSIRVQGNNDNATDNSITQTVLSITPSSSEYVTSYIDMTGVAGWEANINNLDILVRANYSAAEDPFFLDEITFLDAMPDTTYNEFIQNPGFDGPTGMTHLSGLKTFVERSITSTESHDGSQSLRATFSANADAIFWTFSNYEKVYPAAYASGSKIEIKMWVKTNRAAPISVSTRVKLTNAGDDTQLKPIATATTTNTAMGWEELSFEMFSEDVFDGATFWFALNYTDGEPINLLANDVVYIDEISATITDATALSVDENQLEAVLVYPNPTSDILNIKCPAGSNLEVYNILGEKVKTESSVQKNASLNVSNLASGLYIMKLNSEGKTAIKKFQVK